MKKLKSILAICLLFVIASCDKPDPECTKTCNNGGTVNSSCGCDCPAGFSGANCETRIVTPNPIPDCERYGTANISFKNNSSFHYTYDVIWDGSSIATIAYQTVSNVFTVTKGIHTLKWRIHGTGNYGCTESDPNLVECASMIYSCTY